VGSRDLEVIDLSKRYGSIQALNDVTMDAEKGSIVAILGPTGSGKTTLLRCIAGLEMPDRGEIYIGGNIVTSASKGIYVRPEKRSVGMVFQSYALWPHMNVYENIAFPLKVRGLSRDEIDRRVKKIISIVGLEGYEKHYPHQLSGGQQQRVALARAIVYEPRLLLLDEPLSSIDAKLRVELRSWIRGLVKKLSITTLYITHDQSEALSIADKIVIINKGTIMQQGKPMEVYKRPANPFVADFLGVANILEGIVEEYSGEYIKVKVLGKNGSCLNLNVRSSYDEARELMGRKVFITFKGEDLKLISSSADHTAWKGDKNMVKGNIIDFLFEGSTVRALIEVEGCGVELKYIALREKIDELLRSDTAVFYIDPSDIHIMRT